MRQIQASSCQLCGHYLAPEQGEVVETEPGRTVYACPLCKLKIQENQLSAYLDALQSQGQAAESLQFAANAP
jgi:rubredoxin